MSVGLLEVQDAKEARIVSPCQLATLGSGKSPFPKASNTRQAAQLMKIAIENLDKFGASV